LIRPYFIKFARLAKISGMNVWTRRVGSKVGLLGANIEINLHESDSLAHGRETAADDDLESGRQSAGWTRG
jgi:hypothetical protein